MVEARLIEFDQEALDLNGLINSAKDLYVELVVLINLHRVQIELSSSPDQLGFSQQCD